MRLTIDGAQEPEDYTLAPLAFMQVRAENPNQETGNGGAIRIDVQNKPFTVVRNQDSYTVRIGDTVEEQLEGIPI